jgi:hypothetical protein
MVLIVEDAVAVCTFFGGMWLGRVLFRPVPSDDRTAHRVSSDVLDDETSSSTDS